MENSKTTIKPVSPDINSKFLVQKQAFLRTVKLILCVHKSGITFEPLPKNNDQQENILFSDIAVIEAPSHNNDQIIIKTKKNTVLTLQCTERVKCICEIYSAWDRHIITVSPQLERAFPSYELAKQILPNNRDVYLNTQVTIFRAHLEIDHKALKSSESWTHIYTQIENNQSGLSPIVLLPYCFIKTIYKTDTGIIIEMNNSQLKHHLLFYDLEKANNLISKIEINCQEYMENLIHFEVLDTNDSQIYHRVRSLNPILFECRVHKLLESGHLLEIKLAVLEDSIVEIDPHSSLVMQKYDIRHVENIVQMASGVPALCITFHDEAMITYIPEDYERDLVVSNIFTLVNWRRINQDSSLKRNDFIHCGIPNKSLKINGWIQEIVELQYEKDLITSLLTTKNEEELLRILQDFSQNAHFKHNNINDTKPLQMLIRVFIKNAKLLKTKQFLKYWDSLQSDLAAIYKPTPRKRSIIVEKQERFKSFGNYDADEEFSIQLNIKPFLTVLNKTEEALKSLIILLSSKPFFQELSSNKKEVATYESFLQEVISLIQTPYPTLQHLAGNFIRSFCLFCAPNENKIESMNRRFILTQKIGLLQTLSFNLAQNVLTKSAKKSHGVDSLPMHAILASLRTIKTFLSDRADNTELGDFQLIQRLVSCSYYFSIFNFLMRSNCIACVYNTTILLTSCFKNCSSRQLYKRIQNRFLKSSSLIPFNITLVFSSPLIPQRKLSMKLLYYAFHENDEACSIPVQIFPKYLFKRVHVGNEYITKWTLHQWEDFFSNLVDNFDTPIEQWNEECRRELLKYLRDIDREVSHMLEHCPGSKLHELIDPTFHNDGDFLLNIRWNYEELQIEYQNLEKKIKVGKYFLSSLLQDSENPTLAMDIRNPSKLWNELHMKFVNEISQPPLKMILKTQILLYRLYSSNIKEANTISFWLKYLNRKEFVELRYLVLQLLYTFVTVENVQTATANILKFVELEGLKKLADVLIGLYFSEDHNKHGTSSGVQFVEPNSNGIFEYNYTNLHLPKQGYTLSQKKSNSIYLILKIFKAVLNKTVVTFVENEQEMIVYPISRTKSKLAEPKVLNGLVNILLLQDDFLTLEVLDLLSDYFLDKQIYKELINKTPIFDFLLVNLNLNTALSRFSLLLKIYHRVADHLPFDDNPIKAYTDFSFVTAPEEVAARAISHFPPLRYLPKHFMWILINISVTDFVRTFFSSLYEAPELIWTSEMRNHLIALINEQTHAYKERIVAYTEFDDVHIVKDLPEYFPKHTTPAVQNAFLYITPDEVMCGPIILRIWVQKIWKTFEMPKKEIPLFVQNLYILLENAMQVSLQNMTPRQISDLIIILQAHAKAIKIYSIIEYKCFDHVLTVLDFSAKKLSAAAEETDLVQIYSLLILAEKIIYRSISSKGSENIKSLIAENGVPLILSIYNSLSDENSKITRISYSQLKLASLSTRIINQVVVNSFETIQNSIDSDAKLQLFLNLQGMLKISALCFESIRAQYSEKNLDSSQEYDDIEDNTHKDNAVSVNSIKNSIFDILSRASSRSGQYNFYIEKLLHTTKHLLDLSVNLSVHVETAVLYIQSGLAWRLFELNTYFDDPNRYSKKIEDQHYRLTVKFIENACIALRNLLIFAHEAYELKMNSSSSANETGPSELIVKREPVSGELVGMLDKIDGFEKTVLSKFYLVVLKLIGKELTKSILSNYFEPTTAPNEEDRDPILRFMKIFATSFFDPQTLWNNETRQELTELIQDQILSIQQSHGKIFVNKVEPFEYQCYKKELIIDEIFISYFNKTPEWKVANFKQFLLKILGVITELWQEIMIAPALATLIKLNTAVTAIANIIKYHEVLEPLLFEENMTILGTLLNNPLDVAQLDQEELLALKYTVLSILYELSKTLDGATKVIENVMVMRNFIHILRQNSQKSSDLIKKVVEIMKTVIPFDDIKTTVIEYGLIVCLLEASLKLEIHSNWTRNEAFHFVIQIARENKRFLEQIGDNLFTPSIYKLIKDNTVTSEEILNIIENGCEKPETFWTRQMRLEILLALKNTCDEITIIWDQQIHQDIRVVENPASFNFNFANKLKPVFPELKNNILIQNKFLQNLNKNPKFGENDNLMDLMNKLVEYAQNVYDALYKKKFSPQKNEHMTSPTNQGSKINSNRLFSELITVITSLMFVVDYHVYGPKKVASDRPASVIEEANEEDEEDRASNFTQEEPYQPKFDLCVDENLLSFLSECVNLLSHSFFVAGTAGTQLTVTLLQVFYLLTEDEKGLAFLKEVDMVQILAGILRKIVQPTKFQASLTFVEEELILSLLLKIIHKDKTLVPHVIEECIDSLRELLQLQKTHLRELLENIVTVIAQNPDHGREAFLEINKKENLISVSTIHDCQPHILLVSSKFSSNKFWKSPSHGWMPYHAKNTLNILLKQPKETKLHGPIITETAIENLPDRNGEVKATHDLIQDYLSKITKEHSQSYI